MSQMGHERRFKRKSRTSAIPPITDIIAAPPPASAFDTRRRPRAGRLAFWPTVSSSAVDSPVRAIVRGGRETAASTEIAPAGLCGRPRRPSKWRRLVGWGKTRRTWISQGPLSSPAEILLDHRAGFRCGSRVDSPSRHAVRIFINALGLRVHESDLNVVNFWFFRSAA